MVEVSLPDGSVPKSLLEWQNRLPPFAIIVSTLKANAVIGPNRLRAPELNGRSHARYSQVTNVVEVAKSREGGPKGARTKTGKNKPNTARTAHRDCS